MANMLKPIQTHQVQSHHKEPVAPIIQRISEASGTPITTARTVDLSKSLSQSEAVVLLKPKRCSSTHVWYSVNGISIAALMAIKAISRTTCCTRLLSSAPSNTWLRSDKPPNNVQHSVSAELQANSSKENLILATV